MPSLISAHQTEQCLRIILSAIEGYELSEQLPHGFLGCDIIARKGKETIHIEVIGYKESGPARSKDFFQGFFRAVSRIKDGAQYCVIAVPSKFKRGLPQRARIYGEAWTRIGEAFPELEIWLVDVDRLTYHKSSWNEWLK